MSFNNDWFIPLLYYILHPLIKSRTFINMNIVLKKYITVFGLFIFLTSFSQNTKIKSFSLSWNNAKELVVSNGLRLNLPLVESNYIDEFGVPVFHSSWAVSNEYNEVSYSIKNIVFEIIEKNYLQDIPLEKIPSETTSNFKFSDSRTSHNVFFSLTPLVRDGDIVKKIISFDLVYDLKRKISKKMVASNVKNSVLNAGSWYKFSINKTGVFKLDANFLQSIGVSVSGLDPRNIRIYGNGGEMLPNLNSEFRHSDLQENAIFVKGESDGVFNEDDYILFYGRGPHDWKIESNNSMYHRKNLYSEKAFYFLTFDLGVGKRIVENIPVEDTVTDFITSFSDYLFLEEDRVNLIGAGQQWFGDSYMVTRSRSYTFDFDNIDSSKACTVKVRAASTSLIATEMKVSVNDSLNLFSLNFPSISGSTNKATASLSQGVLFTSNPKITVTLDYYNNSNAAADAFLDYIEIFGDKLLIASGKQFGFRNLLSKESNKVLKYTIQNKNQVDMLWDVSDPLEPKRILNESSNSDFEFTSNSGVLAEYHVLNNSNYYIPTKVFSGPISNQNLHALQDIQYLVVTNNSFVSHAQRLANYHKNNSGLSVKVVTLNQIYNEFGSGSPDITAIRDFVKHLYDNASSDEFKIKYLCLFGDSSYDYKDRIPQNNNIVPVFLAYESFNLVTSYVTDDYYGMMDQNEGEMTASEKQDVATGRILISDDIQAEIVVDKILSYYDGASFGNWHNSLTLATDDMDNPNEFVFQTDMDALATDIALNKPQYNIKKIYADAYVKQESAGGSRYPDVNAAISNAIERGTLLFNYFGHGGEAGFASERILTIPDITSWVNFEKSPLFITITCDFTRFDNPSRFTAGEEMIVSRKGGSGSLISTTREVFIFYGRNFNRILMPKLLKFDSNNYTISEALMHTKNEVSPSISQRFFIFSLGDPAMKLATPGPNVVVTHINGKDISQSRDTLKALSKIIIKGEIQSMDGGLQTNFNGELSSLIYDKPTDRKTLNNKGFVDQNTGEPLIMDFEVQESAIFRGKSPIKNGAFEFEFIVPKDIKLSYGNSKVSFYSNDKDLIKGGVDMETIVGGLNEDAVEDNLGPEISLFMNDKSFIDGGTTNEIPKLIAEFSDASGINTSTGAIGHAITVVIDEDVSNTIELNEFYESESGDFTKGSLSYSLRGLEPGEHSLKVKVWDTYNNASDKTLNFTVTSSLDFVLENVLNYPNPFVNYTEFWFTHNQPNELLDVKIYIYTVSGKLVKSIRGVSQASGVLFNALSWDGKDDFGDRVGKGVYVYKLEVTNVTTGVRAEKFEKLVLLQ